MLLMSFVGSLTDSVCTTYENKVAKVGSGTKHDAIGTPAQPYNLTMMLGGRHSFVFSTRYLQIYIFSS